MASTPLDTAPASMVAVLVTFTYGDPASPIVRRYCRFTSSISIGSEVFTAEPTIDAQLPPNHGGVEDKPAYLTMSTAREPVNALITPYRHSPVNVKIEEMDPLNVDTRNVVYRGVVTMATLNPNGRKGGLAKLTLQGVKFRLSQLKLSFPLTSQCFNKFQGRLCQLDASSWERTGTVVSVGSPKRNSVTLGSLSGVSVPATDLANERYTNGSIAVAGLHIRIKKSNEDGSFEMDSIPPPTWAGSACTLHPGCTHQLSSCRVWDNEDHFNGIGFAIPNRNPVFEVPQT